MTTTRDAGAVKGWQSPEFKALCETHGVPATRRQFSKFKSNYGLLALKTGTSRRAAPPGPNSTRQAVREAR